MPSIDIETILTIIYVIVDDWYQTKGKTLLAGKVGRKPIFSDSEVITLMLAADFIPYPGEQQFIGYIRANHKTIVSPIVEPEPVQPAGTQLALVGGSVAGLVG
jgi:hypothetical protein